MSEEIKRQQAELSSALSPLYRKYFACLHNLGQAHAEAREHEYACDEEGWEECVKTHDQNRLKHYPKARTREKLFRTCTSRCSSFRPDEAESPLFQALTSDDIKDMKQYIACMEPCLQAITTGMTEEIQEIREEARRLQEKFRVNRQGT